MLNAPSDASFWVMEAGISEAHDMDALGVVLQPDLALLLNVGPGHLQGLGDRGVAHYKARLLAYLAPGGTAVVNADYTDLVHEAGAYGSATYFSTRPGAAPYAARYLGPDIPGLGRYEVLTPEGQGLVTAPFQGFFGAENVAAVAAAAYSLGIRLEELRQGLADVPALPQRFRCTEAGPWLLIDDSYNANPLSMHRMLDSAADMATRRRETLVLVLGEMLELGASAEAAHEELGVRAGQAGPIALFWKGDRGEAVQRGLARAGYAGYFFPINTEEEFRQTMKKVAPDKSVVLFKGSRGNHMETLAAGLEKLAEQKGEGHAV
jgi:UDP-N-acetylmuramoyl-tripeptide--D-alanyl-D-alanine ligase